MDNIFLKLREYFKIEAVIRLFSFAEVKRSEILGLISFAVLFALLEGVGLSLVLPILQYIESGQTALTDSGGTIWVMFTQVLNFFHLEPTLPVLLTLAFVPNLLRNVVFYFKSWYSAAVSSRMVLRLRMKVVKVVYEADPEFYSRHPVGQLVGVVMGQTATAGTAVLAVINVLGVLFLIIMYVAILLFLSSGLTAVALCFAALVYLVNKAVLRWIANNSLKNAKLGQTLMARVTERMSQMKLVKIRHTKAQEAENIRSVSEHIRDLGIKAAKVSSSVEVIVDPLQMVSVFVTLYIGNAVFHTTLAQLGLLIFVLLRLNAKVKEFTGGLQAIIAANAGVTLTREMYDAAIASNTIKSGNIKCSPLTKGIHFVDTAFEYPDVRDASGTLVSSGKAVLHGIDAFLPAGSFTAIVGRSGAGKSTLVELIPRLRDVTSGEIIFDDTNIKDFELGSLRRSIGYVTQSPMLFNDTIYDNLTYGMKTLPSDEQVRAALEAAHALFVYDLPAELDSKLGDRGIRFSGGERQRIALARVLLEDTDILVFDEPTSALDSESEGYIQQTLNELHGRKTLVVIAHRLSTIVAADQLLLVDEGRVIERGTHEELIGEKGAYAKLFDSQMIGLI